MKKFLLYLNQTSTATKLIYFFCFCRWVSSLGFFAEISLAVRPVRSLETGKLSYQPGISTTIWNFKTIPSCDNSQILLSANTKLRRIRRLSFFKISYRCWKNCSSDKLLCGLIDLAVLWLAILSNHEFTAHLPLNRIHENSAPWRSWSHRPLERIIATKS